MRSPWAEVLGVPAVRIILPIPQDVDDVFGTHNAATADDNARVLRRDRLGGLLHEYSPVA